MEQGYTQQVCFCRVHGSIISQTLPRQTPQHDKAAKKPILVPNHGRNRVIHNSIKGAFNNLDVNGSVEDLTHKFDRITYQEYDPNLTIPSSKESPDVSNNCTYRQYDTVDQDIHINTLEPTYINAPVKNVEYPQIGPTENTIAPVFYQSPSKENYYDPVNYGDGELVHMMLPDGLYIRPDAIPSNTRSLKSSRSPRHRKKDTRSRSKEKKTKSRKDIAYEHIGLEGGFLMPNDFPVYANSLSAPTSPAQNNYKPRNRRKKGNHSYNPNYKKVTLIFFILLVENFILIEHFINFSCIINI